MAESAARMPVVRCKPKRVHRLTAVALAVTMAIIGMPSAGAASDEPDEARHDSSSRTEVELYLGEQGIAHLRTGVFDNIVFTRDTMEPLFTPSPWGGALQSTTGRQARRGALFWMAVGAGIGVGAGLIYMAATPDCRYSESLCPLAPIELGAIGAAFGLLLGLGR